MKIHVSKKDVIWGYLGYFFTLFTNILILPFVMKMVPSVELGLWYTFLSIGQIVSIFDGTFTGSVSRNITYAWSGLKEINKEGFSELCENSEGPNYRLLISVLATCKKIYTVISFIALFFFLTVGTLYIYRVSIDIDIKIWGSAWIIYLVAVFLNLYYSYWLTSLRGVGAIKESQQANVVAKILQIVISLVGLFCNGGIVILALAYLISNIVLRFYGKHCLFKYGEIGNCYKKYIRVIRKDELKDNFLKIWHNAKKNGISCLGAYAITQTTTLVCSAYFGLSKTASYGLALQLITAVAGVASIYFNTAKPKLTELKIGKEKTRDAFIKELSLSIFIYWLSYMLMMIVLLFIGLPVIGYIKSDTQLSAVMILFMGLYLFLETNHSLFAALIEMSNTVPYVKASLISAFAIIIFEFLVGRYTSLGIYGLMFVQFIVQICYNNWKWPSYIMREYRITPLTIIKIGAVELLNLFKYVFASNANGRNI